MKKIISLFVIIACAYISMAQEEIVYDIDSNVYHAVVIKDQIWLKENLKASRYNNGDKIETSMTFDFTIEEEAEPKYQWIYKNDSQYLETYGRLYTYYVIADSRKICPTGWHVATDDEWTVLEKVMKGRSKAGGKLKEGGFEHWETPNEGSKNRNGFSALPGGTRENGNHFDFIGFIGYWWTATERDEKIAYTRRMLYQETDCNRTGHKKDNGMAVRCIKSK
jgi:uncharacterized protein (TIGR02145 family)